MYTDTGKKPVSLPGETGATWGWSPLLSACGALLAAAAPLSGESEGEAMVLRLDHGPA